MFFLNYLLRHKFNIFKFIFLLSEITDLSANEYFVNVYVKTHMRATAYVFGILTGFLVHIIQEKMQVILKDFELPF